MRQHATTRGVGRVLLVTSSRILLQTLHAGRTWPRAITRRVPTSVGLQRDAELHRVTVREGARGTCANTPMCFVRPPFCRQQSPTQASQHATVALTCALSGSAISVQFYKFTLARALLSARACCDAQSIPCDQPCHAPHHSISCNHMRTPAYTVLVRIVAQHCKLVICT